MRGGSHFHKNSELGNEYKRLIEIIKEERRKNPILVEVIEPVVPPLPDVPPISGGVV